MNSQNILRELVHLCNALHADEADRSMVCDEAAEILAADPTLNHPPFAEINATLLHLLKPDAKSKPAERNLIVNVARELLLAINSYYVKIALSQLEDQLLAEPVPEFTADRKIELAQLTGGLLSVLLDGRASLESLFQLYRQILVPRYPRKNYVFARKFGLVTALIEAPSKKYKILFAIDNVTNAADFPPMLGGIKFASDPADWMAAEGAAATYLAVSSRRVFAELDIENRDIRTAGTEAYAKISSVLDLARFEYEREHVHPSDEFLILESDKPARIHRLAIPRRVPNSAAQIGTPELEAFVASVDELVSSDRFSGEGRDRVLSAFRLYRLGADTHSFDNKLSNWWTALEFLIKGIKAGGRIGTAVESQLTPILGLTYPAGLVIDIRHTLQRLKIRITDPASGQDIVMKGIGPLELYKTFTRPDVQPLITTALAEEPYLHFRTAATLHALSDPLRYLSLLTEHEKRIRWQLQRLWRARCDIVHSARRSVGDVLLCANLEFYLKTALVSLLADLRRIRTLESPGEFFERKAFWYGRLKEDLAKKSLTLLESTIAREASVF